MIWFSYDIPSNPDKSKQRMFYCEAEMRSYIKTLRICYSGHIDYSWCWTTLEAQRANGFNT